jgi:hypothetical protein
MNTKIRYITTAFICGAILLLFLVPPHLYPSNYPADDSFFYMQVASNIHEGNGSTFNQITTTNGYHPLWMTACIGSFFAGGGSRVAALHFAIAFQQILALGFLFLFYKLSRIIKLRYWFLALPLFFIYFSTRLYCSEAYLNGFFVLLTLLAAVSTVFREDRSPRAGDLVLIGLCGGLATLARLDNIFVIGSLFLGSFISTIFHKTHPS